MNDYIGMKSCGECGATMHPEEDECSECGCKIEEGEEE